MQVSVSLPSCCQLTTDCTPISFFSHSLFRVSFLCLYLIAFESFFVVIFMFVIHLFSGIRYDLPSFGTIKQFAYSLMIRMTFYYSWLSRTTVVEKIQPETFLILKEFTHTHNTTAPINYFVSYLCNL